MTAFYRRDTATSVRAATLACEVLHESGAQNSMLASILVGLGAIAIAKGNYQEALPSLEQAKELSKRLGNDEFVAMAAGNLALCHLRLGNYEHQRRWALIARQFQNPSTLPNICVIDAAVLGVALVYLGKTEEALSTIAIVQKEITTCNVETVTRLGLFWIADILWLLGRRSEALSFASNAGVEEEPRVPALIGPYSRWSSLISSSNGTSQRQLAILLDLRKNRDRLDALDRAELDCAILFLSGELGLETEDYESHARNSLASLPVACARHLQRLGFLVNDGRAQSFPETPLRT